MNPNAPPAFSPLGGGVGRSPGRPRATGAPRARRTATSAPGWPQNYLVVRLDDEPIVRGPGSPKVTLFARRSPTPRPATPPVQAFWRAVSFAVLPPAEQHLARFLVLLPLADAWS